METKAFFPFCFISFKTFTFYFKPNKKSEYCLFFATVHKNLMVLTSDSDNNALISMSSSSGSESKTISSGNKSG